MKTKKYSMNERKSKHKSIKGIEPGKYPINASFSLTFSPRYTAMEFDSTGIIVFQMLYALYIYINI